MTNWLERHPSTTLVEMLKRHGDAVMSGVKALGGSEATGEKAQSAMVALGALGGVEGVKTLAESEAGLSEKAQSALGALGGVDGLKKLAGRFTSCC